MEPVANEFRFPRLSRYFALTTALVLLSACSATKPTMSIEEAKRISAEFEAGGNNAPPRSIVDLQNDPRLAPRSLFGCEDEPLMSLTEIRELTSGARSRWDEAYSLQGHAYRELIQGYFDRAIELAKMSRKAAPPYVFGSDSDSSLWIANDSIVAMSYAYSGDLESAQTAASRMYAPRNDKSRHWYFSAEAAVEQLKGNFVEAEVFLRDTLSLAFDQSNVTRAGGFGVGRYELLIAELAENLMHQGRLQEAEALARSGLARPRGGFAISVITQGRTLAVLAEIFFEQGRFQDAETIGLAAVDSYLQAQIRCTSVFLNLARLVIARARLAQGRYEDALEQFDTIEKEFANDSAMFERRFAGNIDWAIALNLTGRGEEAARRLEVALAQLNASLINDEYRVAEVKALLATVKFSQNDRRGALRRFLESVPTLLARANLEGGEGVTPTARDVRLTIILKGYLALLSDIRGTDLEIGFQIDAVGEGFRIAQMARGRRVQRAIVKSSVRAAVESPDLVDLIRRAEDSADHIDALYAALNFAQSKPQGDIDENVVGRLESQIAQLLTARRTLMHQVEKSFPHYADLINPKPATIEQVQSRLRPREALLSFYVADDRTYVWAIRKVGRPVFSVATMSADHLSRDIAQLRTSLDPGVRFLGDIPEFDIQTAHYLYRTLLKPVELGWQNANEILIVPHGPLGQLPFSVLTTSAYELKSDDNSNGLFSSYRQAPWFSRQVTTTYLPSVTSLVVLRRNVPGSGQRLSLAAFGDPWYNIEQVLQMQPSVAEIAQVQSRSVRVNLRNAPVTQRLASAKLADLPPLPDTREEVTRIATVLGADVRTSVFVGPEANEQRVKTMNLADRAVVIFATHGLSAGDLDGLHEPALALSSRQVVQGEGDGLLTMSEILGLRLNAEWVVLSACNTAGAEGEGAEAVSGLGRAFLYAGSRAVLVSHWPVETTSTRMLTTELFRRHKESPELSRAKLLHETMNWMIDNGGYTEHKSGRLIFTYAHPIFWAPFTIVGDGGHTISVNP